MAIEVPSNIRLHRGRCLKGRERPKLINLRIDEGDGDKIRRAVAAWHWWPSRRAT